MKNKLTQEEQLFREKLEQASFEYQESDWQEVNQQLDSSGGVTSYGILVKAAAGLAIIAAIAFLFQTYYESEKGNNKAEISREVPVEVEKEQPKAKPMDPQKESNSLNQSEEVVNNTSENNTDNTTSMEDQESGSTYDESQANTTDVDEDNIVESIENNSIEKSEEYAPLVEDEKSPSQLAITVNGKLCVGEKVEFSVDDQTQFKKNEVTFIWSVNGQKLAIQEAKVDYTIEESTPIIVQVEAVKNGETIDKHEEKLIPEEQASINFTYKDIEDPFYDLSVELKAEDQGLENYSWQAEENEETQAGKETTFLFETKGIYDITLTHKSENGCISSITKPVSVNKDFEPYPPNAFTPDGDGINDVFLIESFGVRDDIFEMSIYDLKGNILFFTQSPEEGWNGRKNNRGSLMPRGTYVWKVKIKNEQGVQKSFAGRLKLMDF